MRNTSSLPRLSVILLTRNEEENVEDAVGSLLAQDEPEIEVLVVDSASRDRTVEIARRLAATDPRVRVVASERNIPIGEARNLGIATSLAPVVAFMSADATAGAGWARAALAALASADLAYGRQEHAPPALTPAAVVRGLRYHHFRAAEAAPAEAYASNVNAAIRREVFARVRYVEDGPASALDDVLFTREARRLGFAVAYAPAMLVRHKDATSLSGELAKNRREGYGWGLLAPALGMNRAALAWGGALAAGLVALAALPSWVTLALLGALLYAPVTRRALRAAGPYVVRAPGALAAAVLLSPLFDLAFLYHYVQGLRRRRADLTGVRRARSA